MEFVAGTADELLVVAALVMEVRTWLIEPRPFVFLICENGATRTNSRDMLALPLSVLGS